MISLEVKAMTPCDSVRVRAVSVPPLVRTSAVALALAVGAGIPPAAWAEGTRSSAVAGELVTLMAERKIEAFAVQDPAAPDRFVAALAFPGVQMLVVDARSSSPDYIRHQIAQKQYAEAYSALNSTAVPDTKLFIQDMGCNGLSQGSEQVDVMYERNADQTVFDGKGKASGLSKNDYAKKLGTADERYSAMLTLLLGQLRATPEAGGAGSGQRP
jgi:hypothetical protein